MDVPTRTCYDCPWRCGNCVDTTNCYDTCRGDRVFSLTDANGNNC